VARERHERLGPQLAQDNDLLSLAPAPGVKVSSQSLVLRVVPPDANAQPQAPTALPAASGQELPYRAEEPTMRLLEGLAPLALDRA
jgi:hypothetical protein